MDANFKALEAELSRDLTLRQAYLAVSVFLAKVKCGHSYANFYNQPGPRPDAGIVPDVTVVPDVRSIARNVDAELEAVRKRLK